MQIPVKIPTRKIPKLAAMEGQCKTTETPPDLAAEVGPTMAARPRARAPGMHLPKKNQPNRTKGFNHLIQNDKVEKNNSPLPGVDQIPSSTHQTKISRENKPHKSQTKTSQTHKQRENISWKQKH